MCKILSTTTNFQQVITFLDPVLGIDVDIQKFTDCILCLKPMHVKIA